MSNFIDSDDTLSLHYTYAGSSISTISRSIVDASVTISGAASSVQYKYPDIVSSSAVYTLATEEWVNSIISEGFVISVNGKVGVVTLTGSDISVSSTNSTTIDSALSSKVDKVVGKQLSTEDFTSVLLDKLDGIASGAEVNVQSD